MPTSQGFGHFGGKPQKACIHQTMNVFLFVFASKIPEYAGQLRCHVELKAADTEW